jgi:hypothetical protein
MTLEDFLAATLDYLEGLTAEPPSAAELTPGDRRRAQAWLRSLALCRRWGPLFPPPASPASP